MNDMKVCPDAILAQCHEVSSGLHRAFEMTPNASRHASETQGAQTTPQQPAGASQRPKLWPPSYGCRLPQADSTSMQVLAFAETAEEEELLRNSSCVDCGRRTGSFCDFCKAADRLPNQRWAANQHTPLCTVCDRAHDACHFCRGLLWATPPPFR